MNTTSSTPFETAKPLTPSGTLPNMDAGIKAVADLAIRSTEIDMIEVDTSEFGSGLPATIPLFFEPQSKQILDIKPHLEKFRQFPARIKGTAKTTTLQSFIDLTNRHKAANSVVFASTAWPIPSLTAVIDYHLDEGEPRAMHLDHRITYEFPLTEELMDWMAFNEKPMKQADFALFLEEHAAELASPHDGEKQRFEQLFKERVATPVEVVGLSRHLEVYVGAKIKRQERLQTGERVVEFSEEHSNAKGEKVDIPGVFIVSVQAFTDGEPVRIAARLRYRVSGGDISWFYSLYRWDQELRTRVKDDLATVAKDTALPCFEGSPET
jgi:uncharacterized protein YfdQ (DUF2303 family)